MLKSLIEQGTALIVEKEKIAANGEYNLSGERYRENEARRSHFPILPLGEVAEVIAGQSPPGKSYNDAGVGMPFYQGKTEFGQMFIGEPTKWTTDPQRFAEGGDILMSVRAPVGPVNFATQQICIGRGLAAIRPMEGHVLTTYAFYVLRSLESEITGSTGAAFASINKGDIEKIQIPLPPLEVQREIVAEIEGYQRVIDGARAVVDNYRPQIAVDPEWPMVELEKIADVTSSKRILAEEYVSIGVPFYRTKEIVELSRGGSISLELFISRERFESIGAKSGVPCKGDILVSAVGTIGTSWVVSDKRDFYFKDGNLLWIRNFRNTDSYYLKHYLDSIFSGEVNSIVFGAAYKALTIVRLKKFQIPLPPLETQQAIVAEIEAEQALVAANWELVERFEKKIKAVIGRVWG